MTWFQRGVIIFLGLVGSFQTWQAYRWQVASKSCLETVNLSLEAIEVQRQATEAWKQDSNGWRDLACRMAVLLNARCLEESK